VKKLFQKEKSILKNKIKVKNPKSLKFVTCSAHYKKLIHNFIIPKKKVLRKILWL